MSGAPEQFGTWFRRFHQAPDSDVRLVCLPHAGGSSSFYFQLSKALAPAVDVLAVQYPGRQDRRLEPNIDGLPELADRVAEVMHHLADRPLALFGHSMGAVLAYEVALRMRDAGLPAPVRLFVSGRRAPSRDRDERLHLASDAELLDEVRRLGGPHAALLGDPDIMDMVMPAIRSDYRAVERYRWQPGRILDCPVTVLTGDSDPRLSVDEAAAWEDHTTGPTELRVFPGGHFYLVDENARVSALLADRLAHRDAGALQETAANR
ncbi:MULTISPECIES: alpha/beta fold hydrolase [unclassified Streptomyces]|uniref:thioesterase II family protein n=1 Tax=unclassified Streptomyces TaxID=2593676 RepID=UPI00331C7EC7